MYKRQGIGAPGTNSEERKQRTVGHVLGNFQSGEHPLLNQVLQEVEHGIGLIQRQGFEREGNQPVRLEVLAARDSESLDPIVVTVRAKGLAPS